jgi:hypothetical protein
MKKITLEEAYRILQNASAVIIDDNALIYHSLYDLEGDDENEFLYLSWDDEDGCGFSLKFAEKDNREVTVSGCCMFLYDTDSEGEDDHTQITILNPTNLE